MVGPRREWLFLSRVRFCDRHVADSHQYLEVRQEGSRQGDKGARGPERRGDALLGQHQQNAFKPRQMQAATHEPVVRHVQEKVLCLLESCLL